MAVYLRIDGLDPEDFLDADSDHDESAAHDLADRVFVGLRNDYPRLYDDLQGVIPVTRPERDSRLLEETAVFAHRDETVDDGVSDFVFCSFDDHVDHLETPGNFTSSTVEFAEVRLTQRFDGERDRLDDILPTETEREAAGDDPVRVGTLLHDGDCVVRVDFDHLDVEEVRDVAQ